jgi:putative pyruvate formate lyase activating enzyme
MSDLANLTIWHDAAILGALSWYLDVAENRRPAKFRIAATVGTPLDPSASSEDALWAEFDRLTPIFLARWQEIRGGGRLPPVADGPSLLELCRELAYRMLTHCNFCPWSCRIDRVVGAKFGACKLASGSRVSSHFHHTGEELFYRGTQGSGTIFFTSCNMRCAFCQNGDISTDKDNGARRRIRARGGDGVDAAPRRLPQHQLGRRGGRHSLACYRRRHRAVGPRLCADTDRIGARAQDEG